MPFDYEILLSQYHKLLYPTITTDYTKDAGKLSKQKFTQEGNFRVRNEFHKKKLEDYGKIDLLKTYSTF